MGNVKFAPLVGVTLVTVVALVAARAVAAPTPFLLRYEGGHFVDTALPGGIRHDGRFTASAPFCAAGRAYDVRHLPGEPLGVHRLHTCDDGSGSFTALMPAVRGEHAGTGTWMIIEGTGAYASLRGRGTYTGTLISGDLNVFETISYRTEWQGVVDFDADPPAVASLTATARKLRQRTRAYDIRIALLARDTAFPVSYTADLRAGRALLALKNGSTSSGRVATTIRIRPHRTARSVRVLLTLTDALGNKTTVSRSVRLR
ncbi:MAG TPA: hypothetical protein VE444_04915 [Gaiellaceae bacterium]|nr:hypothetical protein [Gaiellaceae bacterium]